ncbi:hypothetical protein CCACVL1_11428 [Corchorus capsularis]|uniref:Uncharacterized protein n=1 Tax=Corchorus capsularis TaxID=210143 RepID=A0A1R3IL79_COCAP|nr:hypothetical protein CCACVL1_11428 [Corchorus capsularis]
MRTHLISIRTQRPVKNEEPLLDRTICSLYAFFITAAFSTLWYLVGEKLLGRQGNENRAEIMRRMNNICMGMLLCSSLFLTKGILRPANRRKDYIWNCDLFEVGGIVTINNVVHKILDITLKGTGCLLAKKVGLTTRGIASIPSAYVTRDDVDVGSILLFDVGNGQI